MLFTSHSFGFELADRSLRLNSAELEWAGRSSDILMYIPSSTLFTNLAGTGGTGGMPLQIRTGGDFCTEGGWRSTSVRGGEWNSRMCGMSSLPGRSSKAA